MKYKFIFLSCLLFVQLHATVIRRVRVQETLVYAIKNGDVQTINMSIESGADVNNPASNNGETPLCGAIIEGRYAIIEMLLKLGANPNKLSRGIMPLTYAMYNNDSWVTKVVGADKKYNIVSLLIRHGARADIIKFDHKSDLQLNPICYVSNVNLAKLLIHAGADAEVGLQILQKVGSNDVIEYMSESNISIQSAIATIKQAQRELHNERVRSIKWLKLVLKKKFPAYVIPMQGLIKSELPKHL